MRQRIICVLAGGASLLAMDVALLAAAAAQTRPVRDEQAPRTNSIALAPLPVRMFEHGQKLLEGRDVINARDLFEVSAGDGFADSAHALALTYDREFLRRRGLSLDLADDAARLRWSQRALELGRPVSTSTAALSLAPAVTTPVPEAAAVETRVAIVDGTYSSHVLAGCGEGFQSVLVTIERGTISFEHVVKGVPYGWRGVIDGNGLISAAVAGSSGHRAVGRFDEKSIDLTYPQCGPSPLAMRIRWLVR
jgi:hypothetical protein